MHCHSLLRTHTDRHTYTLHAVFIGLNDRGDSFPRGKRGGTSCQYGPVHLPSLIRNTHKGSETEIGNIVIKRELDTAE